MELTQSISDILGRRNAMRPVTDHKWNHLVGIELELENITIGENRIPFYGHGNDDVDFYDEIEGYEDMDSDERDEAVEQWYAQNSGACPAGWVLHNDQSLRNGYEFVTTPAVYGQDIQNRIDSFYAKKFNYSGGPRTSTHIHVDMQDSSPAVLQSLVMVVYTIEDALYQIVDEGRKFGGYSVALVDMPPSRLRNLLNPASQSMFYRAIHVNQNRDRYYGLNFHVGRHGTCEFRYFPGAPSKLELESWVDLVIAIKNMAIKYSPQALADICTTPHALENLLDNELGTWGLRLTAQLGRDRLFTNFEEINALRVDESNPERVNSVVRLNETFIGFLASTSFQGSKKAMEYLNTSGVIDRPCALEDALYYLGNAYSISFTDRLDSKKKSKKEEQLEREMEVAASGYDDMFRFTDTTIPAHAFSEAPTPAWATPNVYADELNRPIRSVNTGSNTVLFDRYQDVINRVATEQAARVAVSPQPLRPNTVTARQIREQLTPGRQTWTAFSYPSPAEDGELF